MSIRPIDLQTLYSQLNQAGKEQAVEKNASALQQAQHHQASVRQAEQRDHSINQTEKADGNLNSVGERKEQALPDQPEQGDAGNEEQKKKDREFFEDPDLGHNLDITG